MSTATRPATSLSADLARPLDVAAVSGEGAEAARPTIGAATAFSIHVCALVLGTGALYFAKDFVLPVVLGLLLTLILLPIVRWLTRRGVPPSASATALVILLAVFGGGTLYALSGPVAEWVDRAPEIGREIETKLLSIRGSVEAVAKATKQVDEISEGARDPGVQRVVVEEPGFLQLATSTLWSGLTTIFISLLLALFLLASGDMVYEKIIKVLPRLSDKKTALRIVHGIERSISRYLLTVTLINAGLGVAVGMAMWVLGMPSPALWGAAAALLNFLPYLGAATGIALTAAIAFVTFEAPVDIAAPPLVYLALTAVEGNIVTPLVLGRRLEINAVAIFVGVAFWGWVWGLVGVFMAVPILVVAKRLAEHLPSWKGLGEFLAVPASRAGTEDDEEEDAEAGSAPA